ncbi:hypothetical protein Q3F42_05505 [Enterococcus faecium]|uniref:hypothetical protein n=1 Tax=Enterococcus faecium TaxID=1352 RepID=UPI000CF09E8B|nr:hypothetical protein [Enterococcus faecium]MDQ8487306.1 hypothetical protein [Enterococcus faecium]PQB70330.1 hypothetical protein CUN26_10635 [Enterococcus faecium]
MRFRETKEIIDNNLNKLVFQASSTNNGNYRVENYSDLIFAINNIQPLGFIDKEIKALMSIKTPLNYQTALGSMTMDATTYQKFLKHVQTIIDKCEAIKTVIEISLPEQSDLSITVGLPDIKSIPELTDFYKKLSKIFTLYFEKDADKIEIQNYDSGSLWTEILFGSATIMMSFGSLIKLCSHIFIKIREHKIAEMQFEELELDHEIKEELKRKLLDKALSDIESDVVTFLPEDNKTDKEKIGNTSKALILLYELLDKGTTFETALKTNKKIKENYPSLETMKSLPVSSKLKVDGPMPTLQLNENKDDDSSDTQETDTLES